jgi:hypothetical protein
MTTLVSQLSARDDTVLCSDLAEIQNIKRCLRDTYTNKCVISTRIATMGFLVSRVSLKKVQAASHGKFRQHWKERNARM